MTTEFDNNIRVTSENKLSIDEISEKLYKMPAGHHFLIFYSSKPTFRNVCINFIKRQLAEKPDSVILLLPFYETIGEMRRLLTENKTEIGTRLILLDIFQVVKSNFFDVPDTEKIGSMAKELIQFKDGQVLIIADMSVFGHIKKSLELLEYERDLHKGLKKEGWKEVCFYHKNDFDAMFTEEQKNELLGFHKDKVITA